MRLAAQAKLGFYPAAPAAIAELLKHLKVKPPNPEKKFDTINILDPCAGEGAAIKQIAEGLNVPFGQVYAVELDGHRWQRVRDNIPGVNILGPASFLGVQITGYSFGLAYVNPPFDDELGGGRREEQAFAERAMKMLVNKGVLVLVCPFNALNGNRSFVEFLDSFFEQIAVYKFPDGSRPYNEIAVIGVKRSHPIPSDKLREVGCLHKMEFQWRGYINIHNLPSLGERQPKEWNYGEPEGRESEIRTWEIPHSWRPHVFKKIAFTDKELVEVINDSPLNKLLKEVYLPPPAAPPLPLDKGHLGLILASGMLDGVVEGPHGVHVVRGSSHKVEYHNKELSESTMNPETGAVTTKDVFSERPVTVIRVVEQDGVIFTHSSNVVEKEEEDADTL